MPTSELFRNVRRLAVLSNLPARPDALLKAASLVGIAGKAALAPAKWVARGGSAMGIAGRGATAGFAGMQLAETPEEMRHAGRSISSIQRSLITGVPSTALSNRPPSPSMPAKTRPPTGMSGGFR